jgi:hypothetical protein
MMDLPRSANTCSATVIPTTMFEWFNAYTGASLAIAAAFGGMLFFSAVMAPLIFTRLPFHTAAEFIREVFPWYYLVMGAAAGAATLLLILSPEQDRAATISMALVALGFVYARQYLMPRINAARDRESVGETGADARFRRLHRQSVLLNGVQLIIVSVVLVRLMAYGG